MRLARQLPASLALLAWVSSFNAMAAPIPGLKPAKDWDLNGYVKYMATGSFPDGDASLVDHLLHQRFNFEYRFDSDFRVNVSMRNRLFYGDTAKIDGFGDAIATDPGYWDLSSTWLDNAGLVGNSQFDRIYLDWKGEDWQVRGGRFRINWAMSSLWNPNDIFNAYSIYDFDYEERAGADALMASRKLGFASSVDLVYSPNSDGDLNNYAARYLFNYDGWDLQLLAGKSGFDRVLGAGFAGDISGAGFRGEISYFDPVYETWPRRGNAAPSALDASRLSATSVSTLEADYSFSGTGNWMLRGSVLHISNPTEPGSALQYLNLPLTARTLSFTDWTYYLDAGLDISPLSRLTLMSSYYQDGSYFIGVNSSYSLADDWQLLMVLQRFDGSGDSLFGEAPATLGFVQLKWSF